VQWFAYLTGQAKAPRPGGGAVRLISSGRATMPYDFLDLATTPGVRAAQQANGSRELWEGLKKPRPSGRFTADEAAFIAARDSFYIATVSETGWPYVQHRGGPPGFLKLLDDRTLGFADFRGNRQYISLGNVAANDRAALFLMDYPQRTRLKILGHARVVDARKQPALADTLADPSERANVERLFLIDIVSYDWNCPQHITPRFTAAEVRAALLPLQDRVRELEAELQALRHEPPRA